MIINSVSIVRGTDITKTINLSTTMESTDALLELAGSLNLLFTYTDSEYSEATFTYYMNEAIETVSSTITDRWNISTLLSMETPGLYTFRVSATNYNNEIDWIDYRVIYDYSELNNMTIELNVDGNYTLAGYTGLTEAYTLEIFPYAYIAETGIKDLTRISAGVFLGDDYITSIILPDTITKIEDNAFNSASNLASMTIYAITPPELGTNVFLNTESVITIHVPAASLTAYLEAWYDTGLTNALILAIT